MSAIDGHRVRPKPGLDPRLPYRRITVAVKDSDHLHTISPDPVVDVVGEPAEHGTPDILVDDRVKLRHRPDSVQHRADASDEFCPQAGSLLVPIRSLVELNFSLVSQDDREIHFRNRA